MTGLTVSFEKSAFRKQWANSEWPVSDSNTTIHLVAEPSSGSTVLTFDVSCQAGSATAYLPSPSTVGGNDYQHSIHGATVVVAGTSVQQVVDIDFSLFSRNDVPRLKYLEASLLSGMRCVPIVKHHPRTR